MEQQNLTIIKTSSLKHSKKYLLAIAQLRESLKDSKF